MHWLLCLFKNACLFFLYCFPSIVEVFSLLYSTGDRNKIMKFILVLYFLDKVFCTYWYLNNYSKTFILFCYKLWYLRKIILQFALFLFAWEAMTVFRIFHKKMSLLIQLNKTYLKLWQIFLYTRFDCQLFWFVSRYKLPSTSWFVIALKIIERFLFKIYPKTLFAT